MKSENIKHENQLNGSISVVIGTDSSLVSRLHESFLNKGHSTISVVCSYREDMSNRFSYFIKINDEKCEAPKTEDESEFLFKKISQIISGKCVTNLIFFQDQNGESTVMNKSVEKWKSYSLMNVEIPLGILDVLGPTMGSSSRVLFLSGENSFLPMSKNGFHAATKTAMAYLMHSLRLEKPLYSVSSGNLIDVSEDGKLEIFQIVAKEIVNIMCAESYDFLGEELVFPSKPLNKLEI